MAAGKAAEFGMELRVIKFATFVWPEDAVLRMQENVSDFVFGYAGDFGHLPDFLRTAEEAEDVAQVEVDEGGSHGGELVVKGGK